MFAKKEKISRNFLKFYGFGQTFVKREISFCFGHKFWQTRFAERDFEFQIEHICAFCGKMDALTSIYAKRVHFGYSETFCPFGTNRSQNGAHLFLGFGALGIWLACDPAKTQSCLFAQFPSSFVLLDHLLLVFGTL